MVNPNQSQQMKLGKPTESRLDLILRVIVRSVLSQNFVQFCSPIEKFNNASSDNSMSTAGMEFFVPVASVLVNTLKRDQVSASF
jgi:hypothetical protein